MLNGVKNKKLFEAFSAEFFLFSQGVIHFALRFTYSLDFFGSFLDQAKNEQVEIRITTGESDFGGIVAKKKATIPPKSGRAYSYFPRVGTLGYYSVTLSGLGVSVGI